MSGLELQELRDAIARSGMTRAQQSAACNEIERLQWELRLWRAIARRRDEAVRQLTTAKYVEGVRPCGN